MICLRTIKNIRIYLNLTIKNWRTNFTIITKKKQERDELHLAIWAIADELRGAVDAWNSTNFTVDGMIINYTLCSETKFVGRYLTKKQETEYKKYL